MKTGLSFLIAAKACEGSDLNQLAHTAEWVSACARSIHELQRERGMSNLYLASGGSRFGPERLEQLKDTDEQISSLKQQLETLNSTPLRVQQGARLFSQIAYVLHALDALPDLRAQVSQLKWHHTRTTQAYTQLIGALLAVVVEAADTSSDSAVAKLLVALFNLMQGKELVGQERALGSALFASGAITLEDQQQLQHLIDAQEKCWEVFNTYAPADSKSSWHESQKSPAHTQRQHLRHQLLDTNSGSPLDPSFSQIWFDVCTVVQTDLKTSEDRLGAGLRLLCAQRIAAVEKELNQLRSLEAELRKHPAKPASADLFFSRVAPLAPTPTQPMETLLERTLMEVMAKQTQELQCMADELESARQSLQERKLLERAKGVLMAHQHISEPDAHKVMRQMAMNQGRRMADVAQSVLALADALPPVLRNSPNTSSAKGT